MTIQEVIPTSIFPNGTSEFVPFGEAGELVLSLVVLGSQLVHKMAGNDDLPSLELDDILVLLGIQGTMVQVGVSFAITAGNLDWPIVRLGVICRVCHGVVLCLETSAKLADYW